MCCFLLTRYVQTIVTMRAGGCWYEMGLGKRPSCDEPVCAQGLLLVLCLNGGVSLGRGIAFPAWLGAGFMEQQLPTQQPLNGGTG